MNKTTVSCHVTRWVPVPNLLAKVETVTLYSEVIDDTTTIDEARDKCEKKIEAYLKSDGDVCVKREIRFTRISNVHLTEHLFFTEKYYRGGNITAIIEVRNDEGENLFGDKVNE